MSAFPQTLRCRQRSSRTSPTTCHSWCQRAEFVHGGPDVFARADREMKRKLEQESLTAPSGTPTGGEAREKVEEEERLSWAAEVAHLVLTLSTPGRERAHKTSDPHSSSVRMCSKVRLRQSSGAATRQVRASAGLLGPKSSRALRTLSAAKHKGGAGILRRSCWEPMASRLCRCPWLS